MITRILKIACVAVALLFFVAPMNKNPEKRVATHSAWLGGCFWLIAARLLQAEQHQKKLLLALEDKRQPAAASPPPADSSEADTLVPEA